MTGARRFSAVVLVKLPAKHAKRHEKKCSKCWDNQKNIKSKTTHFVTVGHMMKHS